MREKEGPGLGSPDQQNEPLSSLTGEENSGPRDRRQIPRIALPPIPQDLAAWAEVEESRAVWWCGRFKLRGGKNKTGALFSTSKPCNSFRCPDCAPGRAKRVLKWLATCFSRERIWWIWVAEVTEDDWNADRLKKRRLRGQGDHAIIRRSSGERLIFSSYDPTGREPPTTAEGCDLEKALGKLADALRLPGLVEVNCSLGWLWLPEENEEEDEDEEEGDGWEYFGAMDEKTWDRAMGYAARLARYRLDVEVYPPFALPPGITPGEWFALVRLAVERVLLWRE